MDRNCGSPKDGYIGVYHIYLTKGQGDLGATSMETSIYEKLGVRRIINCRGLGMTSLGASILRPEVANSMVEASKSYVYMKELRKKAGEVIARVTGAEAGCVCNGAAAGITIMTAACMCGPDEVNLGRLPSTDSLKNEVIVPWGFMVPYLRGSGNCIEAAGAKMVSIGCTTGSRVAMGDYRKELYATINERTAAVFYCISHESIQAFWQITLEDVVEVAHRKKVPVIVDAASYEDLRYPTSAGADLATFSGGKCLGGPSASGLICGRKDLIEACELTEWTIARTRKVGKEEIVGLIVALEKYEKRDWSVWASTTATIKDATRWAKYLYEKLRNPPIPYVEVTLVQPATTGMWIPAFRKQYALPPEIRIMLDEKGLGMNAHEVYEALGAGNPSVIVGNYNEKLGHLDIRTLCLIEGQHKIVAEKIRKVLTEKKKTSETIPYP